MNKSVIVSAVRTPFGKFGGSLKSFTAVQLGSLAIKEAWNRSGLDGAAFDGALFGQVLQAGCGQIPSRQATLGAGLPKEVTSETINRVCASSFRAVTMADQYIRCGDADILIAGGMESMSNAPFAVPDMRWGHKMFNGQIVDLMVHDGLWCPVYDRHMAVHGGVGALEYGVSREEQDQWALRSQQLTSAAMSGGRFKDEIVPVVIKDKRGEIIVDTDEAPRPTTTYEGLAKLPTLFTPENTVTAGNAPGTNDGASALVVMSETRAQKEGCKPLATILGHAQVAEDPAYISTAPGRAVVKLMQQMDDLTIDDIDLFEINEAFAAVPLVSGKIAGWNPEKVNVNGGAIALGHPIGATGGRIIMTLIYELRRRGGGLGVAAICSGGGQGDAILIKVDA